MSAEKRRFAKIMKLPDGMSGRKVLGLPPLRNGLLLPGHREAAELAAKHDGISVEAASRALRVLDDRAHPEEEG